MRSVTNFILCLLLLCPALAMGADFNYGHFDALLKRHMKTGAKIDGVTVNAVDYTSLARDAKRSDSDYGLLLKELAAFDPASEMEMIKRGAFKMDYLDYDWKANDSKNAR